MTQKARVSSKWEATCAAVVLCCAVRSEGQASNQTDIQEVEERMGQRDCLGKQGLRALEILKYCRNQQARKRGRGPPTLDNEVELMC